MLGAILWQVCTRGRESVGPCNQIPKWDHERIYQGVAAPCAVGKPESVMMNSKQHGGPGGTNRCVHKLQPQFLRSDERREKCFGIHVACGAMFSRPARKTFWEESQQANNGSNSFM